MKQATEQVSVTSVEDGRRHPGIDKLVIEEPLEIVLAYVHEGAMVRQSISVTMRTPGEDFDLVRGFLSAEGVVANPSDILSMTHQGKKALQGGGSNVVLVNLAAGISIDIGKLERHFLANSACGVCGKAALELLENAGAQPAVNDSFSITEDTILALPAAARKLQGIFDETGGTHSATAFDARGNIQCLREDIGRHNAVDKLVGALSNTAAVDMAELGLLVSSRASFELLQKAAMAGFPFFVAMGAPSSLAVELAKEFEITLLGFVRKDSFNIYNRPDRVALLG